GTNSTTPHTNHTYRQQPFLHFNYRSKTRKLTPRYGTSATGEGYVAYIIDFLIFTILESTNQRFFYNFNATLRLATSKFKQLTIKVNITICSIASCNCAT